MTHADEIATLAKEPRSPERDERLVHLLMGGKPRKDKAVHDFPDGSTVVYGDIARIRDELASMPVVVTSALGEPKRPQKAYGVTFADATMPFPIAKNAGEFGSAVDLAESMDT
jgi:hypothetical protein